MNYNTTIVGDPYVRVHRLTITWPDSVSAPYPIAKLEQSLAVKLTHGAIRTLEQMPTIEVPLRFAEDGDTPIPLVDFETGEPLGADTTLNQAMLTTLALVRKFQKDVQG